jgi:hypothetical protein
MSVYRQVELKSDLKPEDISGKTISEILFYLKETEENAFTCYRCGTLYSRTMERRIITKDEPLLPYHIQSICDACLAHNVRENFARSGVRKEVFIECEVCKKFILIAGLSYYENERFRDYFIRRSSDRIVYLGSTGKVSCICNDCTEQRIKEIVPCSNCGNEGDVIHNAISLKRGEKIFLCSRCNTPEQQYPKVEHVICSKLMPYCYTPGIYYPRKLSTERNPRFFGVEIEVSFDFEQTRHGLSLLSDTIWNLIKSSLDYDGQPFFYCKYDGSLGSRGIEVVSMPFSWLWYKKNRGIFDAVWNLKKIGYSADHRRECGLHIHTSKTTISSLTVYKLGCFIFRNKNFINKISSRLSGGLNKYCTDFPSANLGKGLSNSKYGKTYSSDHHLALSTSKKDTVELRIFQGTLSPVMFEANLGFYNALIEFCENSPVQIFANPRKMTGLFKKFVKDKAEYQCLNHKINFLSL